MTRARRITPLLAFGLLLASAGLFLAGGQAITTFLPPRTAVVDISAVFDDYAKSKDRQETLQQKIDSVKDRAQALVGELEQLEVELKRITRDSPRFGGLLEQKLKLQLELDRLQKDEGKELETQLGRFLQEIKVEITKEIEAVARAQDLDLVLEKRVRLDAGAPGRNFQWPIVHYSKPEYEITEEVTRRLNERYNRAN